MHIWRSRRHELVCKWRGPNVERVARYVDPRHTRGRGCCQDKLARAFLSPVLDWLLGDAARGGGGRRGERVGGTGEWEVRHRENGRERGRLGRKGR